MAITWILVANSRQGRLFERHDHAQALAELVDFLYPYASLTQDELVGDRHGGAAKGHGRTAHSGTQFEPHTQADEKARKSFALQLARHVNDGVARKQCDELALIASSQMLGELRAVLSEPSLQLLKCSVASDITHYQGEDLRRRIIELLRHAA